MGSGSWWRDWWWVALFSLLAGVGYLHFMKEKRGALRELTFRCKEMQKERCLVLREKEEMHLKIASQSDPAWIEIVLMRDLGVVPEGWLKVHFKK